MDGGETGDTSVEAIGVAQAEDHSGPNQDEVFLPPFFQFHRLMLQVYLIQEDEWLNDI